MLKDNELRNDYMKRYMRQKRLKNKLEKIDLEKDIKDLFMFCYPQLDTDNYSDEDWDEELELFKQRIEAIDENRLNWILEQLKKYTTIQRKQLTIEDVYCLIREGNLRWRENSIQLVNIFEVTDEILHLHKRTL